MFQQQQHRLRWLTPELGPPDVAFHAPKAVFLGGLNDLRPVSRMDYYLCRGIVVVQLGEARPLRPWRLWLAKWLLR
jgi:hypothetical protein